MAKQCRRHKKRSCPTCEQASRADYGTSFDSALWTTVYTSSSYDSGSSSPSDSSSSSSCGSGGE